ncbi:MAG: cell division protein FtsZ [Candidatus Methanoperedenaceae archaeon]|nr:cell division protein FtsZ [Candidatus Methanoperedenaceae archaeon]MDW7726470.1 cell division protein FtsZ [Candidatus Methanoperedens sp.]
MESLILDALKMQGKEDVLRKTAESEELGTFGTPKIVVMGCGGGGNNTIHRLYNLGINGAETIAINTDKIHLDNIDADKKILIGKSITRGLGAGGYPEIGKRTAELAKGTLKEVMKDANLVFVTAGMGGGTGTGVAPVVAQIAKDQGAIVIGMVTSPFRVERSRLLKAEDGLDELRRSADTVIVLDNNRLLDYCPNVPIDQAFSVMDQLISETVKGISETITQPSLINLDYADVKAIMSGGGLAVMLVGEAKGQDKANDVVRNALNHPLLDVDTNGATGCLLHITGGPDMSLQEAEKIASSLTYELDSQANVIWGARIRQDYEGKVRCMAIMTGINSAQIMGPNSERVAAKNGSPTFGKKIRVPAGSGLRATVIDQIV